MSPDTTHSESIPLLDIHEASVLRGERLILDRFSLRLAAGQHTAILGANGSGKSTLIRLIARQIYPLAREDDRPAIKVFGRDRWSVTELRSLIGIVSPAVQGDYTNEDAPLEVFDAVVSSFFAARGLWVNHEVTDTMRQHALDALAQVQASQLIGREMASLSTGEARRVLIARALVHKPRALLLDEPCTGLDPASRRRFLESLRQLAQHGVTLLLVTHHVEEILPEIDHVVVLREGQLLRNGSKGRVLTSEALTEAFGMPMRVEKQGDYYHASVG
ncbi:ABC transporter ATP-binding protein [Dyella nitratireducens]|uniref:ABC transporter ATP-binding protein n=1 Tax=Dyella nitratireducens TaxID=1849580 RepID=A0ABQ1GVR3_9GAMM|nr:ATP-binding cassette domain-containing protein [Dyella nitratireducens]GGA50760.1 ABC transporter ATP-binding protein [Dyella nitratireducens]GLQ42636.1 ABC transporter ATP-binding protein [Dyella nitratireducens]